MLDYVVYPQPSGLLLSAVAGLAALGAGAANVPIGLARSVDPAPSAVIVNMLDTSKLANLFQLQDDWDGEGAPKPSVVALQRAGEVIRWAHESGLVVTDVDADVLGGVGVWVRAHPVQPLRSVWIACMNNSQDTIVLSEDKAVAGHAPWDASDASKAKVWSFLRGDAREARS